MRLLALALLLLSAGAGVRAAPLPQGVTEVDSGLYFGAPRLAPRVRPAG